jgi:hypothetical protein
MGNAPDAVKRLVDHFDQNRDAYLSDSYNAIWGTPSGRHVA